MNGEFTPERMLNFLSEHFKEIGYEVRIDCADFSPVRVPLYCVKEINGERDQLVIDFTTFNRLSKDTFFPTLTIDNVRVTDASPVTFFQNYLIHAKVYFAFPYYVKEDNEFNEFQKVCSSKGIGLLKVSKEGRITEHTKPRPLFNSICNQLRIKDIKKQKHLEYHLLNCLNYFVYYPVPEFKRRAITRREGNISLFLIDKLNNLKNISYKEKLIKLSTEYRNEARDDYQIALDYIQELWAEVTGVEYPEIQRKLEDILLQNPEYRDHFLHQFQVFLLGAIMIDGLYDVDKKSLTKFNKSFKCDIENMWLLASTYHDFNYSIQRYNIWIKEFFVQSLNIGDEQSYGNGRSDISSLNLDAAFVRENFLLKTQELCIGLKLEMDHVVMNFFYEQAATERNHGLLSALSLLKKFENSSSSKINRTALVQTALAIAVHDENIWKVFSGRKKDGDKKWNCNFAERKCIEKLEFKDHPLMFLLIYCDTIQEWGRVGRNYKKTKPRLNDVKIYSNNPTKINVSISMKNNDSYNSKQEEISRVKKFLKDPRFEIELGSRESGVKTTIPMSGN